MGKWVKMSMRYEIKNVRAKVVLQAYTFGLVSRNKVEKELRQLNESIPLSKEEATYIRKKIEQFIKEYTNELMQVFEDNLDITVTEQNLALVSFVIGRNLQRAIGRYLTEKLAESIGAEKSPIETVEL